jgi:hypothetical protein
MKKLFFSHIQPIMVDRAPMSSSAGTGMHRVYTYVYTRYPCALINELTYIYIYMIKHVCIHVYTYVHIGKMTSLYWTNLCRCTFQGIYPLAKSIARADGCCCCPPTFFGKPKKEPYYIPFTQICH